MTCFNILLVIFLSPFIFITGLVISMTILNILAKMLDRRK